MAHPAALQKFTFHMVANQKLQLGHLPGCAPLGHHERRQGMRDIDYLVDLVHSIANRLNELTEQHVKEVAELQERVARLERREFTPSELAALAREVLNVPLADIPLNGTIKAGYAIDAANYEVLR